MDLNVLGNVTMISSATLKCWLVLKYLGYSIVETLRYYDSVNINDMVLLKDNLGTNRMKNIAVMIWNVHLYVIHPMSQPEIINLLSLSFKCNVVGPNDNEEEYVAEPNVVELDEDVNCRDIGLEKDFEKYKDMKGII